VSLALACLSPACQPAQCACHRMQLSTISLSRIVLVLMICTPVATFSSSALACRSKGVRVGCIRACEPPLSPAPLDASAQLPDDAMAPPVPVQDDTITLQQWMIGMNTSPRRIITATLGSTAIALAANFLGVTSALLSLSPEAVRRQRLDTFYPVAGYKRHIDPQDRYTFIYPVRYVADQTVYLRNADQAYARRTQDPMLAASGLAGRPAMRATGPDVAFGPPGKDSSGEENLSVVSSDVPAGFSLQATLGPPEAAAGKLLKERIAKEGEREVELLRAVERRSVGESGLPLYEFEYVVRGLAGRRFVAHFVCVVGVSRGALFTMNSRVPESRWKEARDGLLAAAASFELLS